METKKETKKKEKGLSFLLNDNNTSKKQNTSYKNKKNINTHTNQYKYNEYEPKKFYNNNANNINNDKSITNNHNNYNDKKYNYDYKRNYNHNNYYKKDNYNAPKPHFINSSNKEINNDTKIKIDENNSKNNYTYSYRKKIVIIEIKKMMNLPQKNIMEK